MPEPALQQLARLCCTDTTTLSPAVVSWCFCTAAQEHPKYPSHNAPRTQNPLTNECNSHALSPEVAAHVVTIQMQLRVCVRGFFRPPGPTHRVRLSTPHPLTTPTIRWTHAQLSPPVTAKASWWTQSAKYEDLSANASRKKRLFEWG